MVMNFSNKGSSAKRGTNRREVEDDCLNVALFDFVPPTWATSCFVTPKIQIEFEIKINFLFK